MRAPLVSMLLLCGRLIAGERETTPPAAWQRGEEALAARWEQLTGKYIFQQACVSCHAWGPDYWPRSRWVEYLKAFPANHQPDVRDRYKDLTAMFEAGRMVPTLKQEQDALVKFILAAAPRQELTPAQRAKPFEGFPAVGAPAPDFAVTDVAGRRWVLSELKDKKSLVLVFSRAHW